MISVLHVSLCQVALKWVYLSSFRLVQIIKLNEEAKSKFQDIVKAIKSTLFADFGVTIAGLRNNAIRVIIYKKAKR